MVDYIQPNEDLLEFLKCPVCWEQMIGTIEQCSNGHAICVTCRPRLRKCPQCSMVFTGIRNRIAEDIAATIMYPCPKNPACKVRMPAHKFHLFTIHECTTKFFVCPMKLHVSCTWKGSRSEVLNHFQREHPGFIMKGSIFWFTWNSSFNSRALIYSDDDDDIFWYFTQADDSRNVFIGVQYIGLKKASEFVYGFHIYNSNSVVVRMVHDGEESENSLIRGKQCISSTLDSLERHRNENNEINYQISIYLSEYRKDR